MRLIAFILSFTFLLSCQLVEEDSEQLNSLLRDCDHISISFFDKNDSTPIAIADTLQIKTFTAIVNTSNDAIKDSSLPNGRISFINKGDTSLIVFFSLAPSATASQCGYVLYSFNSKMYSNRLKPKACRLLNEIYYKISKPSVDKKLPSKQ